MGGQTYERVPGNEEDVPPTPHSPIIPDSPPPSFRSRASSFTSSRRQPYNLSSTPVDQTLEDTFDTGNDNDNDEQDDRQRLIRNASTSASDPRQGVARSNTILPTFPTASHRSGPAAPSNDGVFANLNAKPEAGEKLEDHPPTYEQAAADATPPYWETTILAPGMSSDEVYIDGLPVGSFFSFAWNAIISMAFQLVGFLLTYLLHTTHAAKNGSRAGLGVTMISYGFSWRGTLRKAAAGGGGAGYVTPPDPDSHDFDPTDSAAAAIAAVEDTGHASSFGGAWLSYVLMILGWVILIKAVSDFVRARRHEQLILQSPDRGLAVPIVASGETSEQAV